MYEHCEASLLLDYALSGVGDRISTTIIDDGASATVHGDQLRLIQLLRILVEYALSRAGADPASMSVQARDGSLDIDLVDESPDANEQQVATLLHEPLAEPFDEGLGLRLLIARAIAEAHGGSLVAEHTALGGMRLRCRLPLAASGIAQPGIP